jgi:aspartokinase-like uncharacterized kinase
MIVVKVGGSLFDHPALGPALRTFVERLAPADVLLVPGGGPVADAVRELDRVHGLGEESAHWIALRALTVTARLLEEFIPRRLSFVRVLDCFTFAREDDSRPGALPHTWNVTTDSIAARAAIVFRAERLVLLKSVDVPPGTSWEAAANGWVDAHFPQIAATLACPVEIINFRRQLDARA